jgi:hypothetical protein
LKNKNMNSMHQESGADFWDHIGTSMCQHQSKTTRKFEKHCLSRIRTSAIFET